MSVERKGRDDFLPTVQRRGEGSPFFAKSSSQHVSKAEISKQSFSQNTDNKITDDKTTQQPLPVAKIALFARVAGMIFVSMIFLLIMAPFFDDSGIIAGTIAALFGIVWNLIFFGVFALILFPVFRKKLNPQYLSQLAFQINEIKRSRRPPNLNK